MYADNNIRKVNIGMNKDEVIKIMGKNYEVIGARENNITLGYKSISDGIYKLYFEDNKLKEWDKEWLPTYHHTNSSTSNTSSIVNNAHLNTHLKAHRNAMLSTANSDAQREAINAHMDAHERAMTGTVTP